MPPMRVCPSEHELLLASLVIACCSMNSSMACAFTGESETLQFKTNRTNCVELCRAKSGWRINTYWYSIVETPLGLVMFNDANKKYTQFKSWSAAPTRSANRAGSKRIPAFLSLSRGNFTRSDWRLVEKTKIEGMNTNHYRRSGKAAVYSAPEDRMGSMVQAVAPGQSDIKQSTLSRTVLQNATVIEDLFVDGSASTNNPALLNTFHTLFGCETKFGLPIRDFETISGNAGGERTENRVVYLTLTKRKHCDIPEERFRLPSGYKQVRDRFAVMLDDEGMEQFIYRSQ